MANAHFLASIYQINGPGGQTDINSVQGRLNSFPTAGTHFYPTNTTTASGVVCNSIIELLPTGLNQQSKKFYTPTTVSDLNTAAT